MAETELERHEIVARNLGVGCVMSVSGFFGGGMIAVLIAKIVGSAQRCQPPEGLPACNWYVYAAIGAAIGALILPSVTLWRLNSGRRDK